MFAIITDDHSGEELARYELGPTDLLEPDTYAMRHCEETEQRISPKTGYCPVGCCDFTVTLQEEPGSFHCWTSESYFYA